MTKENLTERVIFLASKELIEEADKIAEERYISRGQYIRDCIRNGNKFSKREEK